MNYKDLQNIASLSQQILIESANDHYDSMNRWPYSSPYLQEERAPGVKPYRSGPTGAEVRADAAKAEKKRKGAGKDKPGYSQDEKKYSDWKLRATPGSRDKKGRTVSQRMDAEKPYGKRMTGPLAREYGSRHAAEVTRVVKGTGEPQAVTLPRKKTAKEDYDMFDLILSHLLDEGYADTEEAATAIMANMSEVWMEDMCEMFGPSLGLNVAAARS